MEYRQFGIIAEIEKTENITHVTIKGGDVVNFEQIEELFEELEGEENVHLIIDGDVREVSVDAFQGYASIVSVKIGKDVVLIGEGAFSWCTSVVEFVVDEKNPSYKAIDGSLYTKSGDTVVQYALGRNERELLLPFGVKTIGRSAFSNCKGLISVILPYGAVRIEESAFSCCEELSHIELPETLEVIGNYAFCGCEALSKITIPDGIKHIGDCAFTKSGIE